MLLHKIISLVAFHLQFMFMALLWLHGGSWGTGANTFATTKVLTNQSGRDRIVLQGLLCSVPRAAGRERVEDPGKQPQEPEKTSPGLLRGPKAFLSAIWGC